MKQLKHSYQSVNESDKTIENHKNNCMNMESLQNTLIV